MGMFDYVRCDYPTGDDAFSRCQTKDIESMWGGSLMNYYIDPSGWLWEVNYRSNKIYVKTITDYVTIYPTDFEGPWEVWPELRLHFIHGKVQSHSQKLKGDPWFKD